MRRRVLTAGVPGGLPLLSRGSHPWPRRGACLMEFTALLAGERHRDHPRCTDPVLAAVARAVNDTVSDPARQPLALVAPDLVGAVGAGEPARVAVARRCLLTAARYARGRNRFAMAVALLAFDARRRRDGAGAADAECAAALAELDDVLHDARRLVTATPYPGQRAYLRHGLPAAAEVAVRVVGEDAGPAADEVLTGLLTACLRDYRRHLATEPVAGADRSDVSGARSDRRTP